MTERPSYYRTSSQGAARPLRPGPAAARSRRPGPAFVIWSSLALFAVLFAILIYQGAASESAASRRPIVQRTVIKHRVVTTVVPTPGPSSTESGAPVVSAEAEPVPLPPVTTSAS